MFAKSFTQVSQSHCPQFLLARYYPTCKVTKPLTLDVFFTFHLFQLTKCCLNFRKQLPAH